MSDNSRLKCVRYLEGNNSNNSYDQKSHWFAWPTPKFPSLLEIQECDFFASKTSEPSCLKHSTKDGLLTHQVALHLCSNVLHLDHLGESRPLDRPLYSGFVFFLKWMLDLNPAKSNPWTHYQKTKRPQPQQPRRQLDHPELLFSDNFNRDEFEPKTHLSNEGA